MGQTKRWNATYTKHVHQKRKVYQDGMLVLNNNGSTNKVALYDDSEKLLDSRFLKKDEVVECGGTLAFESHLVDIGDYENNDNPLTDLDVNGRDNKSYVKTETRGQNDKPSSFVGNKKNELRHGGPHHNPPNTKQNIIPERKGSSLHNAGALRDCLGTTQTNAREWNALYTTQKTQKAKRYHDGILRLTNYGSHMNQVILLNEDRTVLGSKYIKSSDCVKTGSTYELLSYLVQICEPRIVHAEDFKKNNMSDEGVAASSSEQVSKIPSSGRVLRKNPLHNFKKKKNSEEVVVTSSSKISKLPNTGTVDRKKPFHDEDFKKKNLPEERSVMSNSETSKNPGVRESPTNKPIRDDFIQS